MNSLKVPDSGWVLAASESNPTTPAQAFHVRLDSSIIESLIRSSRNGHEIHLDLGKTPTLHFGTDSHKIAPPSDSNDYDFFLTRPYDSTRKAERIQHTTTLFKKIKQSTTKSNASSAENSADAKIKSSGSSKGSASSGLDSDLEALQNGLAARDAARDRARVVEKLPDPKKTSAKAKAKLISNFGSKSGSLPTSPGLNAAAQSPSLNPTLSASQLAMERAKEQRFTLVHELAVKDQSLTFLSTKWQGKQSELRPTLEKVAQHNADTDTWTMKKTHWRELDVWNYDYETQDERQQVIDNAIRQYDKQRLSPYEPEWQKLLPKEERGQGKCLSRLQANLAKGPAQPAPKIKLQKADEGSISGDSLEIDKPKIGGEKMSRATSNPLPPKPKKAATQDAQAKRMQTTSKAKAPSQKQSPVKAKGTVGKTKFLSKEFIENSDSSGEEAPPPPPKPKAATKVKDTVVVAGRPPSKAPKKSAPAPAPAPSQLKRAIRDDDDSSSSSGTPLMKRAKPKQPLPAATKLSHRPSDASQNSRGTVASSMKSKNTSPTKSSPLASSPPTNASDLENDLPPRPTQVKKRKVAEAESKPPMAKRRAIEAVSMDVLQKASRFKAFYQQYEALHHEISALDHPPGEKLADLLDMRDRLENMKKEIYRECSPV